MARDLWPLIAGRDADELLFTSEKGQRVDQSNLASRVLKPAARRAGVPWASFHTLRHTAASAFFRAGWNAKQVQLVLGHHSPAFTLSVYVHLIDDDLPSADFLDGDAGQDVGSENDGLAERGRGSRGERYRGGRDPARIVAATPLRCVASQG
jgi:hypothetical protein